VIQMAVHVKTRWSRIDALRKAGVPILRGKDLIPASYILRKRVSLKTVHRALASFKGSLAEELAHMRDEG